MSLCSYTYSCEDEASRENSPSLCSYCTEKYSHCPGELGGISVGGRTEFGRGICSERADRRSISSRNARRISGIGNDRRHGERSAAEDFGQATLVERWLQSVDVHNGVSGALLDADELSKDDNDGNWQGGTYGSQEKRPYDEEDYFYDETRHVKRIKRVADHEDRLKQVFVFGFQTHPPKRRILHDVLSKKSTDRIDGQLIRGLHGKHRGAVFAICDHDDHFHVVHDCSYSNATCRCPAIEYIRDSGLAEHFGRRYSRRIVASVGFTIQHWLNITIYFTKEGENLSTWISPGETGYQVVKLDIYNFNKICNVEKKNWWKLSELRSTFMTSSTVDPKHMALQRLVAMAAKDLTALPGVKLEARETPSSNFYGGTPRRQ